MVFRWMNNQPGKGYKSFKSYGVTIKISMTEYSTIS